MSSESRYASEAAKETNAVAKQPLEIKESRLPITNSVVCIG
jgi:hypothetical protein